MKLELDTYVPGLLLWLTNKLSASASQVYRERFGITVADWRLLAFFRVYPWSTAAQACELMGMDKGAASRAISFLLREGWVESRPRGVRQVEYHVTPRGTRLHDKVYELAMARQEALLGGFSATEVRQLVDMLKRMLDNLEAVRGTGRARAPCA